MSRPVLTRKEDIDHLPDEAKFELIAHTCAEVVAQPERELPRLNTLFHLAADGSLPVVSAALLSLAEVFKEIVPLYAIDAARVRAELARPLPKEERRTLAFELELVAFYDKFVERLRQLRSQPGASKALEPVRLRCLIELYKRLSHFNRALELLAAILRCLTRRSQAVRALVSEFARFLSAEDSPRFYEAKLRLLEAMAAASRSPALFARMPREAWRAALELRFVAPTPAAPAPASAEVERLAKLRVHARPSKHKQRQIAELEAALAAKAKNRPKLDDPRLMRVLRSELRESAAVADEGKSRRLSVQILGKKLLIAFNLLRHFTAKPAFDDAVQCVTRTLPLVGPELFAAGLTELQKVFAAVDGAVAAPARAVQQRLALLRAFLELSRLRAGDEEREDVYVPQSLFRTIVAAAADPQLLDAAGRAALLELTERVLLQRRAVNLVVVENFMQALLGLGRAAAQDAGFGRAVAALLGELVGKYTRLRGRLREEEEESAAPARPRFGDVGQLLNEHFPYHAELTAWARESKHAQLRADLAALGAGRPLPARRGPPSSLYAATPARA